MIEYEDRPWFVSQEIGSELLKDAVKMVSQKNFSIADIGCGDGRDLYALYQEGLLRNAEEIIGVDMSKKKIDNLKRICPFAKGIIADACDLKEISDNVFDIVISNIITFISDDSKMLKEIYRILKPSGHLYISTPVKKWFGFWIYWNKGFKLDPAHVREYKSPEEFLSVIKKNVFTIDKWRTNSLSYPIMDLIVRVLIKANILKPDPSFYLRHKMLEKLRVIKVKVIGYQTIEVVGKVRK